MTWEMTFVFGLLAVTFGRMVWEKLSLDIVAMLAFSALLASGILTPAEAFKVFSNDAAITVACMFVLSAALERTGVIESIAHRLSRAVGFRHADWLSDQHAGLWRRRLQVPRLHQSGPAVERVPLRAGGLFDPEIVAVLKRDDAQLRSSPRSQL